MVESFSLALPNYLDIFCIGSGFNGAYGYVGLKYPDSMWVYYADNKNKYIPPKQPGLPFFIKGAMGGICLDNQDRPIISWISGKTLYIGRISDGKLTSFRLSGIEDKPLLQKCALSAGGKNRIVGWSIAGSDSVYICGWIGKETYNNDETRNWFTQVRADTGKFSLNLSEDTAVIVYNLANNLKMQLWNINNKNSINLTNVNDNGAKANKPNIAIGNNKIAVVWEDSRAAHGDTSYVYFQLFDKGGIPVGNNIALSAGQNPSIQIIYNNKYIISFNYSSQITTNVGGIPVTRIVSYVYAMILDSNGIIYRSPQRLNPLTGGGSNALVAQFFNSGKQLVAWLESNANMTSRRIYGCILDTTGRIDKSAFTITTDSSITDFDMSSIGNYVLLSWHNQSNGLIKALIINNNGALIGEQWTVSNRAIDSDVLASISTSTSDSAAFISWIDGSLLGRTYRRVVGEYFILNNNFSSNIVTPLYRRKINNSILINSNITGKLYTLSGKKISRASNMNTKTNGIYLEQMSDGKLRLRVMIKDNISRNK
jgi:hypothetical protein